jgi:regulator of cell morphogenesis and NO signaling
MSRIQHNQSHISDGYLESATIQEIVARWPHTMRPMSSAGLDLCCGGARTIREAAEAHGTPPEPILVAVRAILEREPRG